MPPEQCPECGRFLKRALIVGLAEAPAPCPRCGVELTADRFGGGTPTDPPATSVRPPDLRPDEVRDIDDPVATWDAGVPVGVAAVRDERPFPVDTVVVLGAAAVGLALGLGLGQRRGRNAVLGALGGAVGAGIARRVWQLP
ncbi:MAG: hypothetical protein WD010_03175 [Nitriliruptor sp.]|uniref:hypothetical protein n=1 Tax=Nitriliruptor sp. TaxID=2448056 RepID=UPI0034A0984B